jgi:hypothetical protein
MAVGPVIVTTNIIVVDRGREIGDGAPRQPHYCRPTPDSLRAARREAGEAHARRRT